MYRQGETEISRNQEREGYRDGKRQTARPTPGATLLASKMSGTNPSVLPWPKEGSAAELRTRTAYLQSPRWIRGSDALLVTQPSGAYRLPLGPEPVRRRLEL